MTPDFRSLQRFQVKISYALVLGCLASASRPAGGDEPKPPMITVTPRIIILEEEEELLLFDAQTPEPAPPREKNVTEVFQPRYTTVGELQDLVIPLLSPTGRITFSQGRGSSTARETLLIQDTAEVVEQISTVIKKIDVPPIQIAIETKILRVTRPSDERSNADLLGSLNWQHDASVDVEEYIKALSGVAEIEVIAAPKLRSLHKLPAEIFVGEQLGYRAQTATETGTSESVEFLESGTTLRIVPVVSADNSIQIEVGFKHSIGTINAETGLPRSDVNEVETTISARDGQTVVVGGLITSVEELIVLLTPRIVTTGGDPAIAVKSETPQAPVVNRVANMARAPVQTAAAKRQSLRYAGNTFEHWQSMLATQLKPEDRLEAMRAVGVFGGNGYAEEATATILDVLNGFPMSLFMNNDFAAAFGELDSELIQAGQLALIRVGAGASPVLAEAVKDRSQKGYGRLAALVALASVPSNEEILTQTVLELLKDPRDTLSQTSLEWLGSHPYLSDLVVERLTPVIGDSTLPIEFRQQAVGVLASYGPASRSAMPALLRFMHEHDSAAPSGYRLHPSTTVIEAIGRIGPVSREAIVRLMQMLEEENTKPLPKTIPQPQQLSGTQSYGATGYRPGSSSPSPPVRPQSVVAIESILHNLPVESLESLTEILVDGDAETSLRELAVISLEKMGPKAKSALPTLRQLLKSEQPGKIYEATAKAVEAIAR